MSVAERSMSLASSPSSHYIEHIPYHFHTQCSRKLSSSASGSPAGYMISITASNLSFNVLDNMQESISICGDWG